MIMQVQMLAVGVVVATQEIKDSKVQDMCRYALSLHGMSI